ncbi:natch and ankyrin domain protein [Penicillium malachiteum]|nr:natch and ankyrin domain protein [Penicillium malachiteum]
MASRDDYLVGWVCALPIEAAAAKATLDRIHDNLPPDQNLIDRNNYILGSIQGHNVVLAYPNSGIYGKTSVTDVAAHLHASFKSVRFNLMVGIAAGVPDTEDDIRLGDVVVSKSTGGRPGLVQYDVNGERLDDQSIRAKELDQSTRILFTATRKSETASIFDESKMAQYISEIVQKDPVAFGYPGSEQDVLFEPNYDHTTAETKESGCSGCNRDTIRSRKPRDTQEPIVHYGRIASGHLSIRHGKIRDKLAHEKGALCLDTAAAGVEKAAQYLVIRGICDYADSHSSKLWHGYAAAAAAAYAKDILSFIPTVSKTRPTAIKTYPEVALVLDALLLTRPEVDRKSLIALKGLRANGTCEWLIQHPRYQEWLSSADLPILWISGGPGKGKTMLAIYITEMLQPAVDAAGNVLLYYFCSNRDKNRNTALTIMRGIIHQWIGLQPHLAQYIKSSFEGVKTVKYTVNSFTLLWRVFLILLRQSSSSQVVCVLDGLDECEKESLRQLLDAVENYLSQSQENAGPRIKLILLSRPKPAILESTLGQYQHIELDESNSHTSLDVKRYILAKVTELASEQNLSKEMIAQVQQALLAGADGTFLWVGFVANELEGRSWDQIKEILHRTPKGLGGVYQRLLQQIDDKEALVPILQWVVLAARPLTVDELTAAAGIKPSDTLPATEVVRRRLRLCGLLVKIEGGVVNLVHESAKEFFQSSQVSINGLSMFYMSQETHLTLMQTCLAHVEHGYKSLGRIHDNSGHYPLLHYASQYWPIHCHHAIDVIDMQSEFSRAFFRGDSAIRDEWWKFYWEHEKNGGNPPTFTLLHLAAYLGIVPWAKVLIKEHARLISLKDNYGRRPLFWAVNQGHREMVELLLNHGARVNGKDRGSLTALHNAVTGQHKDIVILILDHGARLEDKTEHGDTPLIRAIQAHSREIIQILLEHGARVDKLPTPQGVTSLKGPTDPMEERVKELLDLEDEIFLARFKQASRRSGVAVKGLTLSSRFPLVLRVVGPLWMKFIALDRWEHFFVLRELVEGNKTEEIRLWNAMFSEFFNKLVVDRTPRAMAIMCGLLSQICREVAPGDLRALLAMTTIVGSQAKLSSVRHGWRKGDEIAGRVFADLAALAYERDAEESLHFGVRHHLNDFDACIQSGNRQDNVFRTQLLLTQHLVMLENKEPRPIEYFSNVIAEFYEGYIGGSHEVELFSDVNQAFAKELMVISKGHDSVRLLLFVTSIFQFAQSSQRKGQDRFLSIAPASCLIICQGNANAHRWVIGEAIPEAMSSLISKQGPGPLQKQACKAFIECLLIGKQYGLSLPASKARQRMKQHLHSLPEVENMVGRIVGL